MEKVHEASSWDIYWLHLSFYFHKYMDGIALLILTILSFFVDLYFSFHFSFVLSISMVGLAALYLWKFYHKLREDWALYVKWSLVYLSAYTLGLFLIWSLAVGVVIKSVYHHNQPVPMSILVQNSYYCVLIYLFGMAIHSYLSRLLHLKLALKTYKLGVAGKTSKILKVVQGWEELNRFFTDRTYSAAHLKNQWKTMYPVKAEELCQFLEDARKQLKRETDPVLSLVIPDQKWKEFEDCIQILGRLARQCRVLPKEHTEAEKPLQKIYDKAGEALSKICSLYSRVQNLMEKSIAKNLEFLKTGIDGPLPGDLQKAMKEEITRIVSLWFQGWNYVLCENWGASAFTVLQKQNVFRISVWYGTEPAYFLREEKRKEEVDYYFLLEQLEIALKTDAKTIEEAFGEKLRNSFGYSAIGVLSQPCLSSPPLLAKGKGEGYSYSIQLELCSRWYWREPKMIVKTELTLSKGEEKWQYLWSFCRKNMSDRECTREGMKKIDFLWQCLHLDSCHSSEEKLVQKLFCHSQTTEASEEQGKKASPFAIPKPGGIESIYADWESNLSRCNPLVQTMFFHQNVRLVKILCDIYDHLDSEIAKEKKGTSLEQARDIVVLTMTDLLYQRLDPHIGAKFL